MPRISFGVTDEQWAILHRCALQEKRTLSNMAAVAMVKYARRFHYNKTDLRPVTEDEMICLLGLSEPVHVRAGTFPGINRAVGGGQEKPSETKMPPESDDVAGQGSER